MPVGRPQSGEYHTMLEHKLSKIFDKTVKIGSLEVAYPSGTVKKFGDGTRAPLRIRFVDDDALKKLYSDPELQFPELYMHGKMVIEEGDIHDLLMISKLNHSKKTFVTPPAAAMVFQ